MPRARYWCFTINNYADVPTSLPAGADYLIYGKEVAETGTPHLQGFIAFSKRKLLTQVRGVYDGAHWTVARNVPASIKYCKKEGDFTEFGTAPEIKSQDGRGRRNDIRELYNAIEGGIRDRKELRKAHASVCARYPRYVEAVLNDFRDDAPVTEHVLRPWQRDLYLVLQGPSSDRDVIFVVDKEGGKGKTYFCQVLFRKKKALILGSGKVADMAHVLSLVIPVPDIVVIDVCRSKMDTLQYSFLEEVKNGYVFSPKYESCMIRFRVPHLVVMCNEEPDMAKLSADRYNIIRI